MALSYKTVVPAATVAKPVIKKRPLFIVAFAPFPIAIRFVPAPADILLALPTHTFPVPEVIVPPADAPTTTFEPLPTPAIFCPDKCPTTTLFWVSLLPVIV